LVLERGVREATVLGGLPGLTSWPSAIPTWRLGEPLVIVVGGAEKTAFTRIGARLLDRSGELLLEPGIEIGPLVTSGNGLAFHRIAIEPPSVPVGEYRIEVVITDESGNVTASQTMPVLVDDRSEALAWTDSDSPRVGPSMTDGMALGPPVAGDSRSGKRADGSPSDEDAASQELFNTDPERFVGGSPNEKPPTGTIEALSLPSVGARGAALLLSGQSGGAVAGEVVWAGGGGEAGDGLVSIHVYVEVDGGDLLAGSEVLPIPIEVYGYLLDQSGSLVAHIAEGFLLDGRLLAKKIDLTGFKFLGGFRSSPGIYSLRILVRNRQTGRFFLARRDMNIRTGVQTEPYLMPPLVAEPNDSWVIGFQHGIQPDELKAEIPDFDSWPSAMPVWRADQPLDFILRGSELGTGQAFSAQIFDHLGNRVLDLDVTTVSSATSADGLSSYHASVAATDLPTDQYRLAIVLTNSESGQTASQSLPVLVHGLPSTFVWTDPAAPRGTAPPSQSPLMDEVGAEDLQAEAMRAAYLDALRLWADGDEVAARRTLAELERPVQTSGSARGWRQLITLERLTAMSLTEGHPASLMAVAFLHRGMFSWYMARGESALSTHSWQMAATMARIAPGLKGWEPPEDFSESMLVDLAGLLVRSGQPRTAKQLLESAAKVAPGSAPALLGLGALYERVGHPEEAVAPLKTLVENHPDDSEGRLRLAVDLARTGSEKNAEEHFRTLLEPAVIGWIRTIAYQELGRTLVQQGRNGEACDVLGEGVAHFPDNQRLRILLAHALDGARQSRQATAVIEELEAISSQQYTSPRYRYSVWPDLGGERIRSTLLAAENEGLDALREALQ
jgi:Tfp pilus assembly protein PilF